MQTTWTKRSYVCDPDSCDTLIEVTSNDRFGFPSAFSVTNITCLCGRSMNQVSEEDATIRPINERNEMETTGINYNPHQMVELRKIVDGESTFAYYKATELEEMLFANPTITAFEHMTDGTLKEHTLNRADISEMFRIKQYREASLEAQGKQLGQIIDNLTMESWYSDTVDKAEVLRDLCSILDHTPQAEMSWSATLTVSGTTLVNLDEVEDFDIRYHIGDNLSVESNDFQTNVDSWDVDYIDSQDWN